MKQISIKSFFSKQISLGFLFVSILIFSQCTNEITPPIYSEKGIGETPILTSIIPNESGLAGVTEITITGDNFSADPDKNIVFFGALPAKILTASTTELKVLAPNLVKDSIEVKISVLGAEKFSNIELCKLNPAVSEYYPFQGFQKQYSVTTDAMGNVYFSLTEDGAGKGVWKISPDGVLSEFAPKAGETFFTDLKYHSDGYLIGVWGKQAIFKIEAGIRTSVFVNTGNSDLIFNVFDFDKDKNIWAGGKGSKIVSVKPDKSFKLFDYEFNLSAIRIFNDYLYAISGEPNSQNIIRFPIISADSLGLAETIFQFSANVEFGTIANSLTFATDGQMFIAISPRVKDYTDPDDIIDLDPINPLMYVNSDGSYGTWYPNLIVSALSSVSWGTGNVMYVVRERYPEDRTLDETYSHKILKIDMERLGAPEFGRD